METKSRCRLGGNKDKGSSRRPSSTACLPPQELESHPHPYCSLRMEKQEPAQGGGAWHPLWAYLARGSSCSGVPQPGPPPACHCFEP